MITVLLEQIIQLLKGWINKFNDHAEAVEDSLTDLNNTASDIELNTDPIPEIRDNTGAIITPINNINTNTINIKNNVNTIATDTGIIKNNAQSIATSAGAAAAFAEDCATNTLDIKDKITTIASDTTQLRADSANIAADVSSINQALGYYIANTPVTDDVEGEICNFDTDMEDYLQKAICTIPADAGGFSSIDVVKSGKNILMLNSSNAVSSNNVTTTYTANGISILSTGTYSRIMYKIKVKPNVPYTLSFIGVSTGNYSRCLLTNTISWSNPDYGYITIPSTSTDNVKTITPTVDTIYIGFYVTSTVAGGTEDISYIQFEEGESKTEFEPFKSIINTVSLGSTITDGAEIDLLSGIVKINTSPVTYSSITPIAIRTYKGVNNIYSDVGSMSLTYRETLKHYLDKQ